MGKVTSRLASDRPTGSLPEWMQDWGTNTSLGVGGIQHPGGLRQLIHAGCCGEQPTRRIPARAGSHLPQLLNVSNGFLLVVLQWLEQCSPKGMSASTLRLGGNALLEVGMDAEEAVSKGE